MMAQALPEISARFGGSRTSSGTGVVGSGKRGTLKLAQQDQRAAFERTKGRGRPGDDALERSVVSAAHCFRRWMLAGQVAAMNNTPPHSSRRASIRTTRVTGGMVGGRYRSVAINMDVEGDAQVADYCGSWRGRSHPSIGSLDVECLVIAARLISLLTDAEVQGYGGGQRSLNDPLPDTGVECWTDVPRNSTEDH